MKANPEILMVDKLNGKDLKLGEYEVDDETGALYIGTYGTVFPGGSATTESPDTPSKPGNLDGVSEGFKDAVMNFRLLPFPRIDFNTSIMGLDFKMNIENRIRVLPRIDRMCSGNLSNLTINTSFRFES